MTDRLAISTIFERRLLRLPRRHPLCRRFLARDSLLSSYCARSCRSLKASTSVRASHLNRARESQASLRPSTAIQVRALLSLSVASSAPTLLLSWPELAPVEQLRNHSMLPYTYLKVLSPRFPIWLCPPPAPYTDLPPAAETPPSCRS